MKRFRRWLFNGFAAASLLLLFATAGLWLRSFFVLDEILWRNDSFTSLLGIHSSRGELAIYRATNPPFGKPPKQDAFHFHFGHDRPMNELDHLVGIGGSFGHVSFRFLGFACYSLAVLGSRYTWLYIPFWIVVLAAIPMPAYWILKGRHMLPGHCVSCGYDLRATPNRCPECGNVPAKP